MTKQLVLFTLIMCICSSAFGEKMSIGFTGSEVRDQPSAMSSKVLFRPLVYTPVDVIETGKEYALIKDYRNRKGYIHKTLLKSQPAIVITGDRVNVRSGAGTDHNAVFQLSKGETAQLISRNGDWLEIKTSKGQTGWIAHFLAWGE